jgi:hypothetical protein
MALLDIRQKFVEFTGRYDLVVDTDEFADNGADWFINAGQRYLDRSLDVGKVRAKYFGTLLANRHAMALPNTRVIEKVYAVVEGEQKELHKAEDEFIRWFYNKYREETLTRPYYYAPTVLRIAEDSSLASIPGDIATVQYQDEEYSGIFFGQKADQDYGIIVQGLFYSPKLLSDTSRSFWTEVHPEILIAASLLSIERLYRNFEGVKESRASVQELVAQLDMDAVAQLIVDINQMEG